MNAYNDFTFVFLANCVFDNLHRQLGSNICLKLSIALLFTAGVWKKTLFCLFLLFLYIKFKA